MIPGLEISFTQPLQMRLDEAESGIKTDLGIKVVSNNIEQNQRLAAQMLSIISTIPGNADAAVEASEGSGQIAIRIKRDALAQYGLSVADVQRPVELAMGSQAASELVNTGAAAHRDGGALPRRAAQRHLGAVAAHDPHPVRRDGPPTAVAELVSTTGPGHRPRGWAAASARKSCRMARPYGKAISERRFPTGCGAWHLRGAAAL